MLASLIPEPHEPAVKDRPPFPEFSYKVGDVVQVDPAVLEDHEIGNPGFLKQFENVENVNGAVVYIRTPWKYKDEAPRREPCIGVSLNGTIYYYFPEELALLERGVKSEVLVKLTKDLFDLAGQFDGLTS